MRFLKLKSLIFIGVLFLSVSRCWACSCTSFEEGSSNFEKIFSSEDQIVFTGLAVKSEFIKTPSKENSSVHFSTLKTTFQVTENLKDASTEFFSTEQSSMSKHSYIVGKEYLVFAYFDENGRIMESCCARPAEVTNTDTRLKLHELRKWKEKISNGMPVSKEN